MSAIFTFLCKFLQIFASKVVGIYTTNTSIFLQQSFANLTTSQKWCTIVLSNKIFGELSERSKVQHSKCCVLLQENLGFKSLTLRQRLATPYWSQNKAVHINVDCFLFFSFGCTSLQFKVRKSLTIRDVRFAHYSVAMLLTNL